MSEEENATTAGGERIAKYLAECGIASRRNCEQYVVEGRVTVNGEAITSPAFNIDPEKDTVCFEGKTVKPPEGRVYLMLNKPAGYTCTAHDDHAEQIVYSLIPEQFGRVFTIGRLDRDSEGLLLLTNDGDFAQSLMHPSRRILKRYYVECEGQFTTSIRRKLLDGMYDNGEFLQALAVEQKSVQRGICALEIVLGEGRKREVRRLCKDVGLKVLLLRRIAIGKLLLDRTLKVGAWRILTEEELKLALSAMELPRPVANAPRPPAEAKPYWVRDKEERQALRGRNWRSKEQDGESDGDKRRPFGDSSRPGARPQRTGKPAFGKDKPYTTQRGYGTTSDDGGYQRRRDNDAFDGNSNRDDAPQQQRRASYGESSGGFQRGWKDGEGRGDREQQQRRRPAAYGDRNDRSGGGGFQRDEKKSFSRGFHKAGPRPNMARRDRDFDDGFDGGSASSQSQNFRRKGPPRNWR